MRASALPPVHRHEQQDKSTEYSFWGHCGVLTL